MFADTPDADDLVKASSTLGRTPTGGRRDSVCSLTGYMDQADTSGNIREPAEPDSAAQAVPVIRSSRSRGRGTDEVDISVAPLEKDVEYDAYGISEQLRRGLSSVNNDGSALTPRAQFESPVDVLFSNQSVDTAHKFMSDLRGHMDVVDGQPSPHAAPLPATLAASFGVEQTHGPAPAYVHRARRASVGGSIDSWNDAVQGEAQGTGKQRRASLNLSLQQYHTSGKQILLESVISCQESLLEEEMASVFGTEAAARTFEDDDELLGAARRRRRTSADGTGEDMAERQRIPLPRHLTPAHSLKSVPSGLFESSEDEEGLDDAQTSSVQASPGAASTVGSMSLSAATTPRSRVRFIDNDGSFSSPQPSSVRFSASSSPAAEPRAEEGQEAPVRAVRFSVADDEDEEHEHQLQRRNTPFPGAGLEDPEEEEGEEQRVRFALPQGSQGPHAHMLLRRQTPHPNSLDALHVDQQSDTAPTHPVSGSPAQARVQFAESVRRPGSSGGSSTASAGGRAETRRPGSSGGSSTASAGGRVEARLSDDLLLGTADSGSGADAPQVHARVRFSESSIGSPPPARPRSMSDGAGVTFGETVRARAVSDSEAHARPAPGSPAKSVRFSPDPTASGSTHVQFTANTHDAESRIHRMNTPFHGLSQAAPGEHHVQFAGDVVEKQTSFKRSNTPFQPLSSLDLAQIDTEEAQEAAAAGTVLPHGHSPRSPKSPTHPSEEHHVHFPSSQQDPHNDIHRHPTPMRGAEALAPPHVRPAHPLQPVSIPDHVHVHFSDGQPSPTNDIHRHPTPLRSDPLPAHLHSPAQHVRFSPGQDSPKNDIHRQPTPLKPMEAAVQLDVTHVAEHGVGQHVHFPDAQRSPRNEIHRDPTPFREHPDVPAAGNAAGPSRLGKAPPQDIEHHAHHHKHQHAAGSEHEAGATEQHQEHELGQPGDQPEPAPQSAEQADTRDAPLPARPRVQFDAGVSSPDNRLQRLKTPHHSPQLVLPLVKFEAGTASPSAKLQRVHTPHHSSPLPGPNVRFALDEPDAADTHNEASGSPAGGTGQDVGPEGSTLGSALDKPLLRKNTPHPSTSKAAAAQQGSEDGSEEGGMEGRVKVLARRNTPHPSKGQEEGAEDQDDEEDEDEQEDEAGARLHRHNTPHPSKGREAPAVLGREEIEKELRNMDLRPLRRQKTPHPSRRSVEMPRPSTGGGRVDLTHVSAPNVVRPPAMLSQRGAKQRRCSDTMVLLARYQDGLAATGRQEASDDDDDDEEGDEGVHPSELDPTSVRYKILMRQLTPHPDRLPESMQRGKPRLKKLLKGMQRTLNSSYQEVKAMLQNWRPTSRRSTAHDPASSSHTRASTSISQTSHAPLDKTSRNATRTSFNASKSSGLPSDMSPASGKSRSRPRSTSPGQSEPVMILEPMSTDSSFTEPSSSSSRAHTAAAGSTRPPRQSGDDVAQPKSFGGSPTKPASLVAGLFARLSNQPQRQLQHAAGGSGAAAADRAAVPPPDSPTCPSPSSGSNIFGMNMRDEGWRQLIEASRVSADEVIAAPRLPAGTRGAAAARRSSDSALLFANMFSGWRAPGKAAPARAGGDEVLDPGRIVVAGSSNVTAQPARTVSMSRDLTGAGWVSFGRRVHDHAQEHPADDGSLPGASSAGPRRPASANGAVAPTAPLAAASPRRTSRSLAGSPAPQRGLSGVINNVFRRRTSQMGS